jgi:hypothetical protein
MGSTSGDLDVINRSIININTTTSLHILSLSLSHTHTDTAEVEETQSHFWISGTHIL